MSWHYLQGQEEASWEGHSLAGAPSALSRLIPTPGASCWPASETESCRPSQYGTTSEPSLATPGAATLTLCRPASPAPTSQRPARASESTERPADSGWKLRGSFAKYDRGSRSWRTRQCSLLEDSTEFSETWPRWGSMRSGECLARQPPDWLTAETESGLLPTPSGVNGGKNNTMGRVDEWGGSSNPLRGTVIGYLCSPEFEELVMGWPVTWTAPTPLETARFHAWLQMHGAFFGLDSNTDRETGGT